jgi:hypothetical protein
MSNSQQTHSVGNQSHDSLNDAEKGMYDSTLELTAPSYAYTSQGAPSQFNRLLSPISPVHEGITPSTSVPALVLPKPVKSEASHIEISEADLKKPTPVKPRISRWILFELWYNVYRRFFTFVVLFNLVGIILAAVGRFKYAETHLGALVLGNLLCAILMRNELFVRFLYLIAIYGLRRVSIVLRQIELTPANNCQWAPLRVKLAVTSVLQHLGGIHSGCALSGAAYVDPDTLTSTS